MGPSGQVSRVILMELETLAWRNRIYVKNDRSMSPRDRKQTPVGETTRKYHVKLLASGDMAEFPTGAA